MTIEELCADGTIPPRCNVEDCRMTGGTVRWEDKYVQCPHWGSCPLDDPRHGDAMADRLRKLGFGVKYQSPTIERVPIGIKPKLENYIANIEANARGEAYRNLILSGGVGTGKTCAASLVAYAADQKRLNVSYRYSPALFDQLFAKDEPTIAELRAADLVVLDDFGVEYAADYVIPRFDSLVEHRHSNLRGWVITTNADPRKWLEGDEKNRWLARAADRWRESCLALVFSGQSQRKGRA